MQVKLDNPLQNFGPRLRALVEQRGTIEEAYGKIGVSRATLFNWFDRDTPPPGKEKLEKLRQYLGTDAPWILDTVQNQHLKIGATDAPHPALRGADSRAVASRLPLEKRMPTRADCELYLQQLLDAAEAEGSPENMPAIYHRLKKQFPLDEFTSQQTS